MLVQYNISLNFLNLHLFICLFCWGWVSMHATAFIWRTEGNLQELVLFPPFGLWGLNTGYEPYLRVVLLGVLLCSCASCQPDSMANGAPEDLPVVFCTLSTPSVWWEPRTFLVCVAVQLP